MAKKLPASSLADAGITISGSDLQPRGSVPFTTEAWNSTVPSRPGTLI
jgi:hypothetical protein